MGASLVYGVVNANKLPLKPSLPELELVAEDVDVVEISDRSFNGQCIAQLDHRTPFLGLQKFNL